jgi:hypothetical protein
MTRDPSSAETIAVSGLGFIASDPELLNRFLGITGIEPTQIRAAASEPGFLAGVLDFVLAHEPTLLAFAESAGIDPAAVLRARRALPNGGDDYDRSI